ncbi:MAG: glycosyltransferase family 2 protein [Clostridia bacterium]|nr:glycosyltransferase family 2 protein [Oscillospiraceae bacterium]MBQ7032844.1 glycosyltransferase family 2 protein [Clostridia bacterium]
MISVIVPLYNEEEVIEESYRRLTAVMQSLNEDYELILINDGSRDRTASLAAALCEKDRHVRLICFSRNFGHQIAITAGMDYAAGDAVVIIDADLQDPPELIPKMVEKWREGYHVVYGKRTRRQGETIFKKVTAKLFYRFLKRMTQVDIPTDTGDFRLIDRKVCDAMKKLGERNRYVRGLVSWVGFKQYALEYVRDERFAGETKYPLKKMLKLAMDGISSFSYKPLKLATLVGFVLSGLSFLYLLIVLIQKLCGFAMVRGWASILAVQLFFNGVMLIMLGIIGSYIGRIYEEAKGRPLYIVQEEIGFEDR